ncbi:hypothetical protein GCM10023188_29020 [Pontibacter saemangeumensis]|uniref:Por secretion system C-terminal sorting domain-containing protein n=1 Tax=Pontibacter saemangeumensis TaxID=1084525 RepID=A0ABP8LTH8_9BACT
MATGSSGTVYTAGAFSGTAAFGSTSLTSSGAEDAYIAHYTADGDLLWAHQIGGPAADRATAIATDGSYNIYIAGTFSGTADFGGTSLTSSGEADAFIAKYDASGSLLWVRHEGGERIDSVLELSLDIAENVHLAVRSERSSSDEPLEQQVYIYKYGSSGNLQWSSNAGGEGGNVTDISFDSGGNAYVTGDFTGTMVIGGQTFQSPTNTYEKYSAVFTAKFNPDGEVAWAREAYGMEKYTEIGFPASVQSAQIATDKAGNVYISGTFYSGIQFGDVILDVGFDREIPEEVFLAKYDNAGNPVWARWVDGLNGGVDIVALISSADDNLYLAYHPLGFMAQDPTANVNKYDTDGNLIWKIIEDADFDNPTPIHQIALDEDSRLYMTFSFIGEVYILGTTGTEETSELITSDDLSNRFTAIYSAEGAPVWVQQVGTSAISDAPDGVYMAGSFENTATFGTATLTSNGDKDAFLAKVHFSVIDNPYYCVPVIANGCTDYNVIAYFKFASLYSNTRGCLYLNGYTNFYPFNDKFNQSYYVATVKPGQSYPISLRSESEYGYISQEQAYGVWIDYNDDKDFDDPGEFVYASPEVGAEFSGTVTIPADAVSGVRRLRVRSRPDGVFAASESCTAGTYGETQDYSIAIGYCAPFPYAQSNNGSYIDNFSFHTLVHNNSGFDAPGYNLYEPTGTLTTTVTKGESYSLSVQSGPVAQAFGVWIDYNNDLDFDDEGELVYASPILGEDYIEEGTIYSPSVSTDPFTGTVVIPASATAGPLRLRVRSNSFPFLGGGYGACAEYDSDPVGPDSDSFLYGETEDYTIIIEEPEEEPPVITSFSPSQGLPGTTVQIIGAGFETATAVKFNGAGASFEVVSNTELKAVVPAAATTGIITVTTEGGEATSGTDFVVLQPSIFVFAPWWGHAGTKVILIGQNLSTTSEVRFNGVPASNFTVYNDYLVRATVPAGASTGKISLSLYGGAEAISPWDFHVLWWPSALIASEAAADSTVQEEVKSPGLEEGLVAYPNPFQEGVTISATLQQEGPAELIIFSELGQRVREIRYGQLGEGRHDLMWDGKDSQGIKVARGLYFYQVVLGNRLLSGKLLKSGGGR